MATSFSFGFGAPQAQQSAPSLFGTTPAPAPTAGTGLFGAQPQQQQQAAPALFGQTSQPPATTSLFGQSQPAPSLFGQSQPQSQPSLFGQPAQQPSLFGATSAPQQAPSLFSAPSNTSTNLFGQSQTAPTPSQGAPQPSHAPLFGQSQSAASSLLFGAPKPSLAASFTAGASSSLNASQQPVPKLGDPYPPPDPNEASIESRIEAIKQAWDPTDPRCRFQTYFYNTPVPPMTVSMYSQPPPGADDKAWAKAVRENPDPSQLVPALAVGFPAIQRRIESQIRESQSHQARLAEIHTHLSSLASTHSLSTSLRILRASQNALLLSQRLLKLIAKSSALSVNRNLSVRKEEEDLRVALEGMVAKVDDLRRRGNELWSGVGALKSRKDDAGQTEWAVVDEQGMNQVLQILSAQQAGLDLLTQTLNKAAADIEVINSGFGLGQSATKPGRP